MNTSKSKQNIIVNSMYPYTQFQQLSTHGPPAPSLPLSTSPKEGWGCYNEGNLRHLSICRLFFKKYSPRPLSCLKINSSLISKSQLVSNLMNVIKGFSNI